MLCPNIVIYHPVCLSAVHIILLGDYMIMVSLAYNYGRDTNGYSRKTYQHAMRERRRLRDL